MLTNLLKFSLENLFKKKALKAHTHFHIPWMYILEVLITLTTLGNENFCTNSDCAISLFYHEGKKLSREQRERKKKVSVRLNIVPNKGKRIINDDMSGSKKACENCQSMPK